MERPAKFTNLKIMSTYAVLYLDANYFKKMPSDLFYDEIC
jgi:hypothetical protein